MKRTHVAAVLALAAIGLTACSEPAGRANSKLCYDWKAPKTAAVGGDANAAAVDDCARRYAYSLAASDDDAQTVADAVVAACTPQLTRWNQQTLSQGNAEGEATSIVTGQSTTPLGEHLSFADSRSLFYVVQARAGSCAAPPITNGVPDGLG